MKWFKVSNKNILLNLDRYREITPDVTVHGKPYLSLIVDRGSNYQRRIQYETKELLTKDWLTINKILEA